MEEQAQQALAQLLERAVSGIDATVAFSQAQIPDVVEQLLVWHTVNSLVWCAVAVITLLPVCIYWPWAASLWRRSKLCDDDSFAMLLFGSFGTVVLLFLSLIFFDLSWLKIMLAPKLYLLEYAAELVK
jgi:hypothetical protein